MGALIGMAVRTPVGEKVSEQFFFSAVRLPNMNTNKQANFNVLCSIVKNEIHGNNNSILS